ncbi:MAG: TonB-dependent receptor [Acidobacteriaceae bacterium]|nr:TonB-dependent receptor [Acidobacteriaceae bacterium]
MEDLNTVVFEVEQIAEREGFMKFAKVFFGLLVLVLFLSSPAIQAQTVTTGDLAGTLTDATGAVIPAATVTLRNLDTGSAQTATTNQSGTYRFSLLPPGNYEVSATSSGLKSDVQKVTIQVGQALAVNLVAKVQSTQQVVEVNAAATLVNADNADLSTAFSTKQVLDLPAPGGDLTTVAFTVPGVEVSTGMGYGNFSSHGLPGTSNLYTMNGDDYNDPYLNLNNSGASNLLLGQDEVAEATVVQNGYSVQYGRQAGAQVNYVTKGGTNALHGQLLFNFNNHILNANDFFANESGLARPYSVSRQWGADIGGPIIKNKLFFYSDAEGLYYTLPSTGYVVVPSPQLQSYILGHITAAQAPLYQQAFGIYNSAATSRSAVPVTTGSGVLQDGTGNLGCGGTPTAAGGLTGTAAPGGGVFGVNVSCALAAGASGLNTNKEWLETHRVDWNINDKQKIWFRFKGDHGFQPTGTSLLTPAQNEQSIQPQYEGQINHTYVISPTTVNNFIVSFLWYSAIFGPANESAALSSFPTYFNIGGAGGTNSSGFTANGVNWNAFPQGRDSGQGQIVDDFSIIKGKHTIKVGANFRRNRVTDFGYEQNLVGSYFFNTLGDFAAGVTNPATGSVYTQSFSPLLDAHIRFYNLAAYVQDEWAARPNLKITLGIRFDRTANPTCLDHCFSRLTDPFTSASFQKGADIPYNASIQTGLSHPYYSTDSVVPDPRLGIVWSPRGGNSTVIRGGIGLFSDLAPGFLVSNVFKNGPFPFTTNLADGSLVGLANVPGSAAAEAQTDFNAFKTGFFNGQTLSQLSAATGGAFSAIPYFSVPSKFLTPNYLEWSFEVQQPIGAKNVFVATYSGNHGYNLLVQNGFPNAFVQSSYAPGFAGLPTAPPDPRFAAVTQMTNAGISNYNGLSVQFRRSFSYGFQGQISYTWSHALDNISNDGSGLPFSFCSGCSLTSLPNPNVASSYGNADYDVRHNMSADFVWDTPWKFNHKWIANILGNWTLAGKFYWRTGTPFSIIDSTLAGAVAGTNINATLLATTTGALPYNCGTSAVTTPCYSTTQFVAAHSETGFGNVGRNSIYGPHYSDIDTSLYKNFNITERMRFQIGASAYNLINHPNFQNPNANIASPSTFGSITATAIPPTSAYGSFQGSAVSGRVLVLTGRFQF